MRSAQMLIVSNGESGLGYIMQGYMRFYAQNLTLHHTMTGKKDIHPLAIQVMKEDGIDITALSAKYISEIIPVHYEHVINLHGMPLGDLKFEKDTNIMHYNLPDPLKPTKYEAVLHAYRSIREEIKKTCIELAGSLSVVPAEK